VHLAFLVKDTGIGIPADRMDRLFQSFSQVDLSTTRRYGGTGLGLVISRRLAEMMSGSMWADSEVGQGSTFHFTIRVPIAQSPIRQHLLGVQPELRARRVLIVDDNATNRRILQLQAVSWGMLPRETGSPVQALEWVQQGEPFDVAILDMQMPEMDGVALATAISEDPRGHSLPLVMLTSLGRQETQPEEALFTAYLTKPVKASQLYDVLAGLFSPSSRSARALERGGRNAFDSQMAQRLPLHILVAEDNVTNQKLALRLLERLGYRADVAANGLEVIAALQRQPYDIVLMDVQMPEMDGLEATRTIRRQWEQWNPGVSRPSIIAMTAKRLKKTGLNAWKPGWMIMSKPIQVNELMEALECCRIDPNPPGPVPQDELAAGIYTAGRCTRCFAGTGEWRSKPARRFKPAPGGGASAGRVKSAGAERAETGIWQPGYVGNDRGCFPGRWAAPAAGSARSGAEWRGGRTAPERPQPEIEQRYLWRRDFARPVCRDGSDGEIRPVGGRSRKTGPGRGGIRAGAPGPAGLARPLEAACN
jgi:CheY-like chemotaxis protein